MTKFDDDTNDANNYSEAILQWRDKVFAEFEMFVDCIHDSCDWILIRVVDQCGELPLLLVILQTWTS